MIKSLFCVLIIFLLGCSDPVKSRLASSSFDQIFSDKSLVDSAEKLGKDIFLSKTCWNCHGKDLKGSSPNCPSLVDDVWIWPSQPDDLFYTIKYGVRSWTTPGTRQSVMPRFDEILTDTELEEVTGLVLRMQEGNGVTGAGVATYNSHCQSCHGSEGQGNQQIGAPPLNKGVWITSSGYKPMYLKKQIALEIWRSTSREGRGFGRMMPAHGQQSDWLFGLSDAEIKAVVVFLIQQGKKAT